MQGSLEEDLTLSSIESRAAIYLTDSLQVKLNCNKIFALHLHCEQLMCEHVSMIAPGRACSQMSHCKRRHRWSRLATMDVQITGLPVGTDEATVTGH